MHESTIMMQASLRTSALDTLRVDASILRLQKENRVFRVDLEFEQKWHSHSVDRQIVTNALAQHIRQPSAAPHGDYWTFHCWSMSVRLCWCFLSTSMLMSLAIPFTNRRRANAWKQSLSDIHTVELACRNTFLSWKKFGTTTTVTQTIHISYIE